jgi:23S rRNA-/tRNA-specific pseudouridylate synthase
MSKTSYQVTDHFSDLIDKDLRSKSYQGFSLVELFPKTGRTHQIRVVLKHLGHPIVGDSKYVGKKRIKKDVLWCSRQFLHASEIEFVHPYKNNSVSFKAPLAKDLIQSLDLLE